jgi:hypothetical protein
VGKEIRFAEWNVDKQRFNKTYVNGMGRAAKVLEQIYHVGLMNRSTSDLYKVKYPTYTDTEVTEFMSNYTNFVLWCRRQVGFGNVGWVLDKDVLVLGNKIYHEERCVFVPPVINSFYTFVKAARNNGLPFGVSWCESEQNYHAYCSQLNGKNKTLGRFDDPIKAGAVYAKFKKGLASQLAEMFKGQVDNRVIKALHNFDVGEYYSLLNKELPKDTQKYKEIESRVASGDAYNPRNTSGTVGVRWRKDRNVWESSIFVDYKHIGLYYGPSLEEAINARKEAEQKYRGEINE